jgi:hypothetical protein
MRGLRIKRLHLHYTRGNRGEIKQGTLVWKCTETSTKE